MIKELCIPQDWNGINFQSWEVKIQEIYETTIEWYSKQESVPYLSTNIIIL